MSAAPATLRWEGEVGGHLVLLDQTRLPGEVVELHCRTVEDVWQAIRRLAVRGAPAIGVAAAYGVCLALHNPTTSRRPTASGSVDDASSPAPGPRGGPAIQAVLDTCDYLSTSRPTAVNLFWALDRMRRVTATGERLSERLLAEARAIHAEDAAMCASIGRYGADLLTELPIGANILTHCNAGALATGGDGTALAVIFELARRGRRPHVWVDETRPLLQGARLTAWELNQRGVDCTLICDSMAAQVMREGRVQAVVVGADRIAANGDAANKIGTYGVAVLARAHGVPFYVAAPTSTFDLSLASGDAIPIEERASEEITHLGWHWRVASAAPETNDEAHGALATRQCHPMKTAPAGVAVYNPAFDVTPARLIRAIITDRGVIEPVSADAVARLTHLAPGP